MSADVVAPVGKQSAGRGFLLLLGFAVVGALVAVSLGFYGKAHAPTGRP